MTMLLEAPITTTTEGADHRQQPLRPTAPQLQRPRVRFGPVGVGPHGPQAPRGAMVAPRVDAGLRLTRRGRLLRSMVLVLLMVSGLALAAAATLGIIEGFIGAGSPQGSLATITLEPGETLWSFASRVQPSADPYATIFQIRELNGLSAAESVPPGSVLRVPVGD